MIYDSNLITLFLKATGWRSFLGFLSRFTKKGKIFNDTEIILILFYRPQRSWGKVIYSEVCVKNSVHRGDMHGRGVCMVGGACMVGEACMVGGHAWLGGMCGRGHVWLGGAWLEGHAWLGGMHGWGSVWQGACVVGGVVRSIRSMSGRYASYWNAFLFIKKITMAT